MKIKKSFLALLLCVTMICSFATVAFSLETNQSFKDEASAKSLQEFDENNITLSFGAISDVHLSGNADGDAEKKFEKALKTLKTRTNNNLDAVLVAGDLTDYAYQSQIEQFKRIFDEGAKINGTELIYALGNHDTPEKNCIKKFSDTFGESYFTKDSKTDADKAQIEKGNRFVELNGYYFIAVNVEVYYASSCTYTAQTKEWLAEKLKFCNDKDPNKPIFIATHAMIYDTTYGSTLAPDGPAWFTKDLIPVLKGYPQALVFSGHLHFPLEDERSIMQTDFTTLGCGSVYYMGIESGYTDMDSLTSTVPRDAWNFSQGLLVQVDNKNNTKITRMDFFNDRECGEPWIIPAPNKDKTHLTHYGKDRADRNKAPTFEKDYKPETSFVNKNQFKATINAATDDVMVHHYRAELKIKGSTEKPLTVKTLSGFYRAVMPQKLDFTFKRLLLGETYELKIFAVDSWDADSIPLTVNFTVPEGEIVPEDLIPDVLNLSFKDGKGIDSSKSACTLTAGSATSVVNDNSLKMPVYKFDGSANAPVSFTITDAQEKTFASNFTADVIFKAEKFTNFDQHILSNNAAGGFAFIIPAGSQKLGFSVMIGGRKLLLETTEDITIGKYYRATATFDQEQLVLYLNGKEQIRLLQSGAIVTPKGDKNYFSIGAKPSKTGELSNVFTGTVAMARLFTIPLDRTHVKALPTPEFPDTPATSYEIGDVTRDKVINTKDSLTILKSCAAMIVLDDEQMILANYNKDEKVDTRDSLALLKFIVGL